MCGNALWEWEGTACLLSMVCERPSSTEPHRVRQTQWLCSTAKGLQNHYDKRMKTRQERRGCQTIEKTALKRPVTTTKSNLRYSGEMSMSGKENLLDWNSMTNRQWLFLSRKRLASHHDFYLHTHQLKSLQWMSFVNPAYQKWLCGFLGFLLVLFYSSSLR